MDGKGALDSESSNFNFYLKENFFAKYDLAFSSSNLSTRANTSLTLTVKFVAEGKKF